MTSVSRDGVVTDASNYMAVIDSGTSVLVGPKSLVGPLIEGITVNQDCTGTESLPDITFGIDGIDYLLTQEDYVLRITQGDDTECVLGFMAGDFPPQFNYMILGDIFMRRYHSYFDKNNNRVGFATVPRV
jgi:cathepsin D